MPLFEFSSTAEAWFIGLGFLFGGPLGIWSSVRFWQDRAPLLRRLEAPAFWPFPDPLWRGFLRMITCNGILFGTAFGLGAVDILLAEPGLISNALVGVAGPLRLLFLLAGLSTFFFDATIVLWARPRRFIPVRLRHLPGAIAEWRGVPWQTAPHK